MADAVTSVKVTESPERIVYHLTNISDGTGESAVVKADASTLFAENNEAPVSLEVEEVRWNVQGFSSVRLAWGTSTPVVALALANSGYEDFRGDHITAAARGLKNPRTSTGEPDILLTTAGALSGATYDITIKLRKSPN